VSKWPTWVKVLLVALAVGGAVGASQFLLYIDRMSSSKFDF
jgi:hypothetical protein